MPGISANLPQPGRRPLTTLYPNHTGWLGFPHVTSFGCPEGSRHAITGANEQGSKVHELYTWITLERSAVGFASYSREIRTDASTQETT
jgi:hypothetical protein